MASRLIGLCRDEVSAKTALEGKPDVWKRTRPVWEGALGNQRKQQYTERPHGDSAPALSCRKTRMAPSFYPHQSTTPEPKASSTWERLEDFVREHVQRFIQALLKEEVTELLGRTKSTRREA